MIDANRKLALRDADPGLNGGVPGLSTHSGARTGTAHTKDSGTSNPQQKVRTNQEEAQRILEEIEKSSDDETSDDEEFVSPEQCGINTGTVTSQIGLTSVAPLSDVGSNIGSDIGGLKKIPGSKRPTDVKIPKFPCYNELTSWIGAIGRNLWTVSQYDDKGEIAWLKEVHQKTFEELADSGEKRYVHLDSLLISRLEERLPKDLKREYEVKQREADKMDNAVVGRQIIKLVIEYFRTSNSLSVVYSYQNMHELQWFGDNKIPELQLEWERVSDNLETPLTMLAKRDLLFQKMENSKIFDVDLAHYRREKGKSLQAKVDTDDYSFKYLWGCMNRIICEAREDRMVENRRNSVKAPGNRGRTPATPAPSGGAAPKDKAKPGPKNEAKKTGKGRNSIFDMARKSPPKPDSARPCWYHQKSFHGGQPSKFSKEDCRGAHGPPTSEANFNLLERPGSRSPSATGKGRSGGKGKGNGGSKGTGNKDTFVGVGGVIIPKCCKSFRTTGKCTYAIDNPGKTCTGKHWDQAKYEAERKKLNPDREFKSV